MARAQEVGICDPLLAILLFFHLHRVFCRFPCLCCPFRLVLLTSFRDGTVQIISPSTTSPRTTSTLERLSLKRMFHTVSDRVSPRHLGFGSTSTSSPFGGGNTGGSLFGNTSSSFGSGGGTCSMTGFLVSFAILLVFPASFPFFFGRYRMQESVLALARILRPNTERRSGIVSEASALFPAILWPNSTPLPR